MLDIKLFRENPDLIFESEKKRFRSTENAEKVIEYDTLWREGERKLNSLRAEKNKLSKSFKKAKQEGNMEEVIAKSKEVANEIKELSAKNAEYLKLINEGKMTADTTYFNQGYEIVDGWKIQNAEQRASIYGVINMKTALYWSLNTGSIQAL